MKDKILGLNNPNDRIFVVPQEFGLDQDDRYFGSIGDATMKHIDSMSGAERQCWEDLYMAPSGAIFRREPSNDAYDPDPLNMRGCDLDYHKDDIKHDFVLAGLEENRLARIKNPKIPKVTEAELQRKADEYIKSLEEAYAEEERRREASEDALDQDRVPYHEWEKYPQLWEAIDIPSAPKDRFIYLGDTRQQFYDYFPEDHPDKNLIQRVINMLNRDWEIGMDQGYADFCKQKIQEWHWKIPFAMQRMMDVADYLCDDNLNADEVVINALTAIDRDLHIRILNQVAAKAMQDPVIHLIMYKEKEWQAMFDAGQSVHRHITQFGKLLYTDFRSQLNSYHWDRYRRAKVKFAPRVLFRSKDINRCGVADLREVFNITTEAARNIWHARPFESVEELYNKGYIRENSFYNDEVSEKVIGFVEKHAKLAVQQGDKTRMAEVRQTLIKWQQRQELNLSSDQWQIIWRYYKLLRAELDRRTHVSRQQEGERRV